MLSNPSKFPVTVDRLIRGLQSGEIVLASEEEDWERVRIPLMRLFERFADFMQAMAETEARGSGASDWLCGKALALTQSSLDLFRPDVDVCASYWTLPDDNSDLMLCYYPSNATDRFGQMMLGKVPVEGSPCGKAISGGLPVFIGDMQEEKDLDEAIVRAVSRAVRCVAVWPLTIVESSRREPDPVAALLVESRAPLAIVDNAPARLLLKACAFLFELSFQIGLRESQLPNNETPETAPGGGNASTD